MEFIVCYLYYRFLSTTSTNRCSPSLHTALLRMTPGPKNTIRQVIQIKVKHNRLFMNYFVKPLHSIVVYHLFPLFECLHPLCVSSTFYWSFLAKRKTCKRFSRFIFPSVSLTYTLRLSIRIVLYRSVELRPLHF